jgi:hypothetical protein
MIEISTKAKLANLEVLSQKNRQPDENPGAKLSLEMNLPPEALSMFAGAMRASFYEMTPGKQGALDGLAVEQLTKFGEGVGVVTWPKQYSGHKLTIDLGLGGPSNIVVSDCTISGIRIKPEAGSAFVRCKVESADISEAVFGKLAKLKSCEISIVVAPPEAAAQQEIEQPTPRKGKTKSTGHEAGDAFAGAHAH